MNSSGSSTTYTHNITCMVEENVENASRRGATGDFSLLHNFCWLLLVLQTWTRLIRDTFRSIFLVIITTQNWSVRSFRFSVRLNSHSFISFIQDHIKKTGQQSRTFSVDFQFSDFQLSRRLSEWACRTYSQRIQVQLWTTFFRCPVRFKSLDINCYWWSCVMPLSAAAAVDVQHS